MKKSINKLTLVYYCIYVLAVLVAVGGYYLIQQNGIAVEEKPETETLVTSIYILYLVISIPLALKLFNVQVKKLAVFEDQSMKIKRYMNYSLWRLIVIGVSLLVGIALFYWLNSRSMMFGAAVAAIALVFCKPNVVKMVTDLDIYEDDDID